jgi:hypothetical protein
MSSTMALRPLENGIASIPPPCGSSMRMARKTEPEAPVGLALTAPDGKI